MPFIRKNIRLPEENYVGKRAYFLTLCRHRRKKLLRDEGTVEGALRALTNLARSMEFAVHAYCFMPDHVHLLCEGLTAESRLLGFVSRFKQRTAFEYLQKNGAALWQFKFYDHILRGSDSVDRVAWYIWMNPVRKGLCGGPLDYPFSGSLTIPWKSRAGGQDWIPPWKKGQNAGPKGRPGATKLFRARRSRNRS